jgi:hypothetical protein
MNILPATIAPSNLFQDPSAPPIPEIFAALNPGYLQMPRKPRFAPPGYYLHITQRGNCRQRTFFSQVDYSLFRDLPLFVAPIP